MGGPAALDGARRDVLIWRSRLLPGTETFIADQAASLRRWHPRFAGMTAVPSPLVVHPELIIGNGPPLGSVRYRWMRWQRRSPALARLLRSPTLGVVHAHFGADGVLVAPEVNRAGLPLVVSFHGHDVTRMPQDPRDGPEYRHQLLDLFVRADVLLAASGFIARRLLALGAPEHKVVQHYTGIPLAPFSPPPSAHRVLFVGRMIEVKGVHDLLTAVAALPAEHRDVPVHLYGEGPLRPALERRARHLGLRAEFHGHRPPGEVSRTMAAGGIFCAPSRRSADGAEEGLGTVFLEAAAHGLPVVAYRSGGVPEATSDQVTGLLAAEGDVPALSASLHQLLTDPDRSRALGLAGRARVENTFDIHHRTAELEHLYDHLHRPTRPRTSTERAPAATTH